MLDDRRFQLIQRSEKVRDKSFIRQQLAFAYRAAILASKQAESGLDLSFLSERDSA